jgi:mRNA interferase MazF
MNVKRGDVVLINLPFAQGGGSKIRPALVIQCDRNNGRLTNTIIASITRNIARVSEPTQVLIEVATPAGRQSGLLADSAVTCENLFTAGRQFVIRKIGRLPDELMTQVNDALKSSIELP